MTNKQKTVDFSGMAMYNLTCRHIKMSTCCAWFYSTPCYSACQHVVQEKWRITMSVRCRLGDIMKEMGLSNKEVVELTGISRNTITSLAANATKRIDYDTLEGLCRGLRVTPGDLIEYIPEDDEMTVVKFNV
ncbi:helix-turn-helix domain-containing protein [Paenibacillus macerans]|uniref:helix-turn-helix domain-containing protein n=1 Tax=Paenibacillus macerans TaxID=44252 RepID=UPI003D321D6E